MDRVGSLSKGRLLAVFFSLFMVILINVVVCNAYAGSESAPKVLLIPRGETSLYVDSALTKEVVVMISMLEEAGFEVVVASNLGQPFVGSTVTLKPDLKLADWNWLTM
jgi:hypothetical protein